MYVLPSHIIRVYVLVVVVFFTLTDRASTYPVIYVAANPVRGHKEVRRSTGHIMVTTRYSDQQSSKSRQKFMRLYKYVRYVCMYGHYIYSRVWINRVRLSILLVVS